MKQLLFLLIAMCTALTLHAQRGTVSGTVKNPSGTGIAHATVRELDASNRVVGHTTTDANGIFTFKVKDMMHSIQVIAPAYRKVTHKMLGHQRIHVTLEPRRKSPLVGHERIVLSSDALFCGKYLGEEVPQWAWIEQLNDTAFTLILPIQTETTVDEYSQGRTLTLLSASGRQLMQWANVVDAYPVTGQPGEISHTVLTQSYTGGDNSPGISAVTQQCYAYPHFQFSLSQLRQLVASPDQLHRIVVDTYKADNYWNFYPTSRTAELLRSVLERAKE